MRYAKDFDSDTPVVENCKYMAALAEIQELEKDKARIDWLADPTNRVGSVLLPTVCVEANLHCLRAAIDMAMTMPDDY